MQHTRVFYLHKSPCTEDMSVRTDSTFCAKVNKSWSCAKHVYKEENCLPSSLSCVIWLTHSFAYQQFKTNNYSISFMCNGFQFNKHNPVIDEVFLLLKVGLLQRQLQQTTQNDDYPKHLNWANFVGCFHNSACMPSSAVDSLQHCCYKSDLQNYWTDLFSETTPKKHWWLKARKLRPKWDPRPSFVITLPAAKMLISPISFTAKI